MLESFKPMWRPIAPVARELGFNTRHLLTLVERGELPLRVERFGHGYFVSTATLDAYRASVAAASQELQPS